MKHKGDIIISPLFLYKYNDINILVSADGSVRVNKRRKSKWLKLHLEVELVLT